MAVLDTNGTTVLGSANANGIGAGESLSGISLLGAGQYYLRVTGSHNAAQMYQLDTTVVSAAEPDPGVTITQSGGSTDVAEDGTSDTYTVVLDSAPTSTVTVMELL